MLWLLAAALCSTAIGIAAGPAPQTGLVIGSTQPACPLSANLLYLEDATHALTIDAVSSAAHAVRFQPVPFAINEINFGYSHSAYWLALPLRVAADAPALWLLEIAFPSLDRVEVYTPRPGNRHEMRAAGDLRPFSERPVAHRNLVFPVRLAPGAHTVYLRVKSEGTLTIPATLWQPAALHQHDQKRARRGYRGAFRW